MQAFEYASARNKQQAVELLGRDWESAAILAGGTDLLSLMKDYVVTPKRLVNIKEVEGLDGVDFDARRGLRLGALVNVEAIAGSDVVRQNFPALAAAAGEVASPQIRTMGTLGGNLCQRPRCWYFRNGMGIFPHTADGKSLVLEGDNRYHAILGNDGPAYYVHPSTLAPMLIAYSAQVKVFGPKGERSMALAQFYRVPKDVDDRGYALEPNEVVTEVVVPPAPGVLAAQYEVRQKAAFDWPLATASVVIERSGGSVQQARVVLGQVAPVPWRSSEAEQVLAGGGLGQEQAQRAGEAAVKNARSLGRNAYKIQLARVAVKRAILKAAEGGAA